MRPAASSRSGRSRRLVASALLVAALVPSVVFAIIPLGFTIGLVTGISESSLILPTVISSAIIGATVGLVSLHNTPSSPSAANVVISATVNPKQLVPLKPIGWKDPLPANPRQPLHPDEARSALWHVESFTGTDPNAVCNARVTSGGSTTAHGRFNASTYQCEFVNNASGAVTYSVSEWPSYECPSPSVYNTAKQLCEHLTPGKTKPADQHCTILRTGNAFAVDPFDPDCVGTPTTESVTISGTGNQIVAIRADGSRVQMDLQTDGTTVVTDTRPINSDQTRKTTLDLSAPDTATGMTKVTGIKSELYQGTGTSTATEPNQSVSVSLDKTGLATDTGQQSIKDAIDGGGVSPEAVGLTENDSMDGVVGDSQSGSIYASLKAQFKDGWSFSSIIPAAQGCTASSGTVHGQSTLISYCGAVDAIRELIGWLLYIATFWLVFRIFTKV